MRCILQAAYYFKFVFFILCVVVVFLLKDTLRECHPDDKDCKVYLFWAAPLVLITFVIMVHFLLVNLVVSSIIQALDDGYKVKLFFFK